MLRAVTIAAILTIFALGFPTQSSATHHGSNNPKIQKQLDDLEEQEKLRWERPQKDDTGGNGGSGGEAKPTPTPQPNLHGKD